MIRVSDILNSDGAGLDYLISAIRHIRTSVAYPQDATFFL
jgi:hypothetical protein